MLDLSTYNNRHHPAGSRVLLLTQKKKREGVKQRRISQLEKLKLDGELKPVKYLLEPAVGQ